jgi:hypothetical protein
MNKSQDFHIRFFLDALICVYFVITLGGLYMTFTHKPFPILTTLSYFSYGMLAPYQGDSDYNVDVAVIAYEPSGATVLLNVHKYFPGVFAERNSRLRLEQLAGQSLPAMRVLYTEMLTQILEHEHQSGHPYTGLRLYWEKWPRSAEGYSELRPQSERFFLVSVP